MPKRIPGLLLVVLTMVLLPPQAAALAQTSSLAFTDLGMDAVTLNGMYGSATVFIPYESMTDTAGDATFEVTYVASPLIRENRSTLTVIANDLEVASIRPVADNEPHTFSFTVPQSRMGEVGLALVFQGLLRVTNFECEITNDPGQWLHILGSSSFSMERSPSDVVTLADLPGSIFTENVIEDEHSVIFVLPSNSDAVTMSTAAKVAARLGQESPVFYSVEAAYDLTDEQRTTSNLVVIGQAGDLPILNDLDLPAAWDGGSFATADGQSVPAGHAVVQTLVSPWAADRYVLIVTAVDTAGLALAGDTFADPTTYNLLDDAYEFIEALSTADPAPGIWTDQTVTMAELGSGDRVVRGTGVRNEYFVFNRPPGWLFDEGSELTLDVASSLALNPDESYVSAFINEIHVGTVRTGQGDPEPVSFRLPVDALNTNADGQRLQTMTLRLEVANLLHQDTCEVIDPETAWTSITRDSSLTLPHTIAEIPDLQVFPYPFVNDDADLSTIVVPTATSLSDLSHALNIAQTLGRYAPDEFLLAVQTAADAPPADSHVIVIGSDNPYAADILSQQPVRSVYQALNAPVGGVLATAQSPWDGDFIALAAVGASTSAADQAARALYNAHPPVAAPGIVALVDDDGQARIVTRLAEDTAGDGDGERRLPQPEPWLVLTITLVLATLAIIVAVNLAQRRAAG